MRIRRTVLLAAILVILCLVSLLGAGCREPLRVPSLEPQSLRLNLPRLRVAFDEQGDPSVLGLSLSSVERFLRSDLGLLRLPAEQVQQFMQWNIQHIELAVAADGLFIFMNNKPLPYLAWNAQTLANFG